MPSFTPWLYRLCSESSMSQESSVRSHAQSPIYSTITALQLAYMRKTEDRLEALKAHGMAAQ